MSRGAMPMLGPVENACLSRFDKDQIEYCSDVIVLGSTSGSCAACSSETRHSSTKLGVFVCSEGCLARLWLDQWHEPDGVDQ